MALYTVRGQANIPEGAIRVTKEEALQHQRVFLRDWKNDSDVIFLRYSKHMAALLVFATSALTSHHFRSVLQLGSVGRISMFLPSTCLPTICSMMFFDKYITDEVLLMRKNCPMCFQFPFGAVQVYNGVIQPIVLSLTGGIGLALKLKTLYLPDVTAGRKKYFKYIFDNILKPAGLKIHIFAALHILSIVFFPYMQHNELLNIMRIAQEKEELEMSV